MKVPVDIMGSFQSHNIETVDKVLASGCLMYHSFRCSREISSYLGFLLLAQLLFVFHYTFLSTFGVSLVPVLRRTRRVASQKF